MDEMLRVLNGNRGDAAFLSDKRLDSVRLQRTDDALRCTYAWKTWLLHLCAGLLCGPGFTLIVARVMQRKGQNLADVIDELGYYFAIGGGLMIAGMWLFVLHTLLSRRFVEFDFANRQVVFRYFGFGNVRYVIPLADVASVYTDSTMRRNFASESSTPTYYTTCVLVLSLNDGWKIKVFETNNQDVAREAEGIVYAKLNGETASGQVPRGYSGLGW
jgi:hypothetical protein